MGRFELLGGGQKAYVEKVYVLCLSLTRGPFSYPGLSTGRLDTQQRSQQA